MAQITQILLFSEMSLLERSKISLRMTIFQKKIAMDVLGLCLPYLKLFSRVPVKCFSLYDSNNPDSVVFGNTTFGEIKDHKLRTTPLVFFFMAQITQILLFSGMPIPEKDF